MEKKKNNIIYVLIVAIFFVIACVFVYDMVKENEPVRQTLDVKEKLVKDALTMLNKGGGCSNTIYDQKTGTVTAESMDVAIKWMMSYTNVPTSDYKTESCSKFKPSELFTESELQYQPGCGRDFNYAQGEKFVIDDGSDGTTTVISEDVIKREWENIFGPDTYKRVEAVTDGNKRFSYVDSIKGYVLGIMPVGGTCAGYQDTVKSSYKLDNTVVITSEVVFDEANIGTKSTVYQYVYTFQQNEKDGRYYFTKLDKAAKN